MSSQGKLEVRDISKSFGSLKALDDVSADFSPGQIHAVLGENGAGKSTLMNVLAGFLTPDRGMATLDGSQIPLGHPQDCRRLGIEMIHQHFTLVPAFSVEENLALAGLGDSSGLLDRAALAEPSVLAAKRLNWNLDLKARAGSLPVGAQQRIEILKALGGRAKVLIFDEPTAVLSPDEVEDLFRVLRELKAEGLTVILIAHKLAEVMAIADAVTVLRGGRFVASAQIGEVDAQKLADWMVGEMPERAAAPVAETLEGGLEVTDLWVKGSRGEQAIRGISFQIHRGEILGFGGVDGNGQLELAEALAGVRPAERRGWFLFDGRPDPAPVGYIPQDRQTDGLALGMSILDNLLVTGHRKPTLNAGPFLRMAAAVEWARELIAKFEVKAQGPLVPAGALSGGNQQKLVVSRAFDEDPDLLVAVNPTRGLDIRANRFVHEKLLEAKRHGAAVALISTDLDELFAVSDRVVFLSRGELSASQSSLGLLGSESVPTQEEGAGEA